MKIYFLDTIFPRVAGSLLALISVFSVTWASAQDGYYIFPIDAPPLLSANFGELRSNHFHSGVDIKTGGVEGADVYAVADGYISRIGIKPSGYGRVLYITHPNGTTTVYAHLREFMPEVERWVKEQRYKLRQHTPDLWPDSSMFPVRKGEVIAHSGNSGSSGGPHLHFEVRRTSDQSVVNPVSAGHIKVTDTTPPRIVAVYWLQEEKVAGVTISTPHRVAVRALGGGRYDLAEPLRVSGQGCFAVEVRDTKDLVNNKFAVYGVSVDLNDREIFGMQIDNFSFGNTRYVNDVMHYPLSTASQYDILRLSKHESNPLGLYRTTADSGVFLPVDGDRVLIEVSDDCGNISSLSFTLAFTRGAQRVVSVPTGSEPVVWNKEYRKSTGNLSVVIPAGAFYQNSLYSQIEEALLTLPDTDRPILSPVYTLRGSDTPLHKSMTLSLSCYLPDSLRTGVCMARLDKSTGRLSYVGGSWKNGSVSASTTAFGTYCLTRDSLPPTVKASFVDGADLTGKRSVQFTVSDDFSGVASYEAKVDGRWVILDKKGPSSPLVHTFDTDWMVKGKNHTLEFVAIDGVGNRTVMKYTFKY